jgi:UDP-N-acetylmuramoyl-L-alanyl-D-glutamate--2,6-diaminopimelate ligase
VSRRLDPALPRRLDPAALAALGLAVTRLESDSRRVRGGDTFVAHPGARHDGREFIAQALAAGATSVLWEPEGFRWKREWRVPNLPVPRLQMRIGELASALHGYPSRCLRMVGVTGTNGKTSCTHWLAQSLTRCGRKAGVIGTLGNGFPGALDAATHTTPDAISLQALLADFLARGAQAIAMEVSSHGLDQGRVTGTEYEVAMLTNLTRDHLDYHGTMRRYKAAKAKLFRFPSLRHAVLNFDDDFGVELAARLGKRKVRVIGYGFRRGIPAPAATIRVRGSGLAVTQAGVAFDVACPWGRARLQSRQLGRYNAENLLGCLAALLACDVPFVDALGALAAVDQIPGRLERLGGEGQPLVVVDYAHTPDALAQVLGALREMLPRPRRGSGTRSPRLVCVFGCGGDRDAGKRPLMGEVATQLADEVIVTSDNPRRENPRAIIDQIIAGARANYHVIEDRALAIAEALARARPADIVLVAGKGHEPYQEIGTTRLPFSDVEVVRVALEGCRGRP